MELNHSFNVYRCCTSCSAYSLLSPMVQSLPSTQIFVLIILVQWLWLVMAVMAVMKVVGESVMILESAEELDMEAA
ncbi:hypothetical protein Trydic_g16886 [Trypoxylus dichotomus]